MQVLAHNMLSQFSNRQLKITSKNKAKSAEKLTTGYQINRSGDDVAGLTISEKMRWQIKGLNKASNNIQDGISLIQVADGALEETHAVLQRMRELSVQAANDTNTETDRDAIQKEIDALTAEVDRIAEGTSFNGEIYPLLGTSNNSIINAILSNYTTTLNVTNDTGYNVIFDGNIYPDGSSFAADDVFYYGEYLWSISPYNNDTNQLSGGSSYHLDVKPLNLSTFQSHISGIANRTDGNYTPYLSFATIDECHVDENGYIYFNYKNYDNFLPQENRVRYYLHKNMPKIEKHDMNNFPTAEESRNNGYLSVSDLTPNTTSSLPTKINIQAGALANQAINISLVDATASGIGLTDISVSNYDNASSAISTIDDAISKVSDYRSNFGAQQNRLEYAKAVADNTSENTQAAESRIRDTEMAEEMVQLSKHNILEQAGQSMLAQANQSQQGILQLLQ